MRCTNPRSIPAEGMVIGHEGVSLVEEVGEGVSGLQVGDIVCSESIQTCGVCRSCRCGQFNQCDQAKLLGLRMDGCTHGITNAVAEGINSKIMSIKRRAGGYRNIGNFKTAVLFYCGGFGSRPR